MLHWAQTHKLVHTVACRQAVSAWHGGSVVSLTARRHWVQFLAGAGPFCEPFAFSLCARVGFLRLHHIIPTRCIQVPAAIRLYSSAGDHSDLPPQVYTVSTLTLLPFITPLSPYLLILVSKYFWVVSIFNCVLILALCTSYYLFLLLFLSVLLWTPEEDQ